MMRFTKSRRALGLLALAAMPALAFAGMPLQAQVTGQVSSVEGSTAVRIDGTTYLIAPNSPAAQDIHTVSAGDTVGLVLNGPAGSATSEVVYITHTGAGRGGH
ncbi:MAG TPA: hypothetical protein VMF64_11490 [Steroidobacteraceae bacterium]|nr:hypothetical protein [Steroidobacteraceae bacterium]